MFRRRQDGLVLLKYGMRYIEHAAWLLADDPNRPNIASKEAAMLRSAATAQRTNRKINENGVPPTVEHSTLVSCL